LENKKNFYEIVDGGFLSLVFMADLKILTVDAPEVTGREKYIS
jgi:hypothetical protein